MKKLVCLVLALTGILSMVTVAHAYTGTVNADPYLNLRSTASSASSSNIQAYIPDGTTVTFTSTATTNGFLWLTSAPSHKMRDFSDESVDRRGYASAAYID